MTNAAASADGSVCPFLREATTGLGGGGCCTSRGAAVPVSVQHEAALCRSPRHALCSRYQPALPVAAAPAAQPAAARQGSQSRLAITSAAMVLLVAVATTAAVKTGNPFGAEPEAGVAASATVALATPVPSAVAAPATIAAATPPPAAAARPTSTPTPAIPTAPAAPQRYTVQRGDTLTGLSARFGVPLRSLAAANRLAATAQLRIGQQLVVPLAAAQ